MTQAAANAAFSINGGHSPPFLGQRSSKNSAFLFKPGVISSNRPAPPNYSENRRSAPHAPSLINESQTRTLCPQLQADSGNNARVTGSLSDLDDSRAAAGTPSSKLREFCLRQPQVQVEAIARGGAFAVPLPDVLAFNCERALF
jgi:hypothetical protein